jgi:hypothetical protein
MKEAAILLEEERQREYKWKMSFLEAHPEVTCSAEELSAAQVEKEEDLKV